MADPHPGRGVGKGAYLEGAGRRRLSKSLDDLIVT